jgi:hypothetical protein
MAVTDFDTKVALIVRDDLEVWQRLNVTAFLMSGIAAEAIGETPRSGRPHPTRAPPGRRRDPPRPEAPSLTAAA